MNYRKMAGTAAVFVDEALQAQCPVESNGMVWNASELAIDELASEHSRKPNMANVLALEGLEDYDPATPGDVRHVDSLDLDFIYHEKIRGWVQVA